MCPTFISRHAICSSQMETIFIMVENTLKPTPSSQLRGLGFLYSFVLVTKSLSVVWGTVVVLGLNPCADRDHNLTRKLRKQSPPSWDWLFVFVFVFVNARALLLPPPTPQPTHTLCCLSTHMKRKELPVDKWRWYRIFLTSKEWLAGAGRKNPSSSACPNCIFFL